MTKIKAMIQRMAHLGEMCMYCKLGSHCGGCSCCQQQP